MSWPRNRLWIDRGLVLENVMHTTLTPLLLGFILAVPTRADVVVLPPVEDATLYSKGGISNGAGEYLFAGRTWVGSARRAVLRFDLQGSVPPGSTVSDVSLTLYMSRSIAGLQTVDLHRLTASWGEGSIVAAGNEGVGFPASVGIDATWGWRFYNTVPWQTAGGDIAPAVSASLDVAGRTFYTWGSTETMIADVQSWIDDPATSSGWILIGNELLPATNPTAKRFDSRENATEANRPTLTVTFTPPTAGGPSCNASDGSLSSCPCSNPGGPTSGCDNIHGTGGVYLSATAFQSDGLGGGTATLTGAGYPPTTAPTVVGMRGTSASSLPVVFGDGLQCVTAPVVLFGATFAAGGVSTLDVVHGAGPGTFLYQLWYRSTPSAFCDATAAFNSSNAWSLTW